MASQPQMSPQQVIYLVAAQLAQQYGVNPGQLNAIAQATAQNESGDNPNAVGDRGTSFGLFQLHEGGELGNQSPGSVMGSGDYQNALTAMTQIAEVMRQHPGMDPGEIAAMAQRPANQGAYAAAIDSAMGNPTSANAAEQTQNTLMSQMSPSMPQYGVLDPTMQNQLASILGMPGGSGIPDFAAGAQAGMPQYQLMSAQGPNGPYPGGGFGQTMPGLYPGDPNAGFAPGGAGPYNPQVGSSANAAEYTQAQQAGNYQPYLQMLQQYYAPAEIMAQLKGEQAISQNQYAQAGLQLANTQAGQGYQNTIAQLGLQGQAAAIEGGALERQQKLLPEEYQLQAGPNGLFALQQGALQQQAAYNQFVTGQQTEQFKGQQASEGSLYTPGYTSGLAGIQQASTQTAENIQRAGQQLGIQEQQYGLNYSEQVAQLQDAVKNLLLTTEPGGYLSLASQAAGENYQNTLAGNAITSAADTSNAQYGFANAFNQLGQTEMQPYLQTGLAAMSGTINPMNPNAVPAWWQALMNQMSQSYTQPTGTVGGYNPQPQGGAGGGYFPPPPTQPKKPQQPVTA